MFYDLLFLQLDIPQVPKLKILDFGSGLGVTSNHFVNWHGITAERVRYSCRNNFWWCLNNAAKGIARDELSYVMNMLNDAVRTELHDMIGYYIGTQHGFNLSVGRDGKYFKCYLSLELYSQYAATYSGRDYNDVWEAIYTMCNLFHTLALSVTAHFGFTY